MSISSSIRMKTVSCWLWLILFSFYHSNAADFVWTGGSGAWNLAANWSPALVPGNVDNAFVTNSGNYTVTLPAGSTASVGSLTIGGSAGSQTVFLDRATLTINGSSSINTNGTLTLSVSQSVLNGAGDLNVAGTLDCQNGTMSGAGSTTIGSSGQLLIGSAGVTLARNVVNSGTITWAGGNLAFSAGALLNNASGGELDISADGHLNGSAGTPLNNSGTVRVTGGGAGTLINAPFSNSGLVEIQTAGLSLNFGGTHTGSFAVAAGGTLAFGGGSHTLSAVSHVSGAGIVSVSGSASVAANGVLDPGNALSVNGGVVTIGATGDLTGAALNLLGNNAVVLFGSGGSVAALSVSAGTLGGSTPIVVSGPLSLSGGAVTNQSLTAAGGVTITGNVTLNGTKLINPLLAVWSAGNLTGANGATISNLFGASFINTFDGNAASGAGATPLFVNAGSFQKTNGTAALGATSIDFEFINTGLVEVQTNTLRYGLNQQITGLTLLDGGFLDAQAQSLQFAGGTLVGTGSVSVANTKQLVNSASVSPGLPLGELDVSGNYQQTALGTLYIELGGYAAGTNSDLVTVTSGGAGGVATLGGTLNVTVTNNFTPTNGAVFTFLTALSRAGTFAIFNYPSNDIGMQLVYDASSAAVKVTNLKPVLDNPITNPVPISYGDNFQLQIAANTFSDPDNDTLAYSASGMPSGISFDSVTRTFSGIPTVTGLFPVQVKATDSGVPSLSTTAQFTLTVTPAVLAITAQPESKSYGQADPELGYLVSGLKPGDSQATILSGSLARTPGETVAGGPYSIGQGTLSATTNYLINFTGNVFTILPAALSVRADDQSKTYGAPDPALTAAYSGFVNGESLSSLGGNLVLTRQPGAQVGNYFITPAGLTSQNYTITFTPGSLSITRAGLSVTPDAKTKSYGATDPALTVSYSGLVNGDLASSLAGTLGISRSPGEAVGAYSITASGLTSPNYDITFNPGSFVITKALLSVTADPQNKTYGNPDPAFSASYQGFVTGETTAALGGALVFSRNPGENVGAYTVTPSGLTSSNYDITLNSGVMSITKAPLSVEFVSTNKVFGTPNPVFAVVYSGLTNGDTAASLQGGLVFQLAPGTAPGDYQVTAAGLTSPNYAISYSPGIFTISALPAPIVLSISSDTGAVTLGWNGVSNVTYRVQFTADLNDTAWTDLPGDILADGTGPVRKDVLSAQNRFYRVIALAR
jgi:hypothetical protein